MAKRTPYTEPIEDILGNKYTVGDRVCWPTSRGSRNSSIRTGVVTSVYTRPHPQFPYDPEVLVVVVKGDASSDIYYQPTASSTPPVRNILKVVKESDG